MKPCLHELNRGGGFAAQHSGTTCGYAYCEEEPVVHVRLPTWCANVCAGHGKALAAKHFGVSVEKELKGLSTMEGPSGS